MKHQRIFDYPSTTPGAIVRVNALQVTFMALSFECGLWRVLLAVASNNLSTAFALEQDARDFFDLWTARVEDAH